ncbi:MAG TPA: hypothetical protein VM347_38960 [Nonomuraea sp.]|nr:hypothetical protein [Nonomuraea sp.]
MSQPPGWKTLADGGESNAVVLAIDFDATGRPEARFSDLVANLTTDCAVWETVPPPMATPASRDGAAYVDYWSRRVREEGREVRAVLGYCAGAVYAAALSERLGDRQDAEPLLLLFDPELVVPQTLLWQFHKVVGFMSSVIPEEEINAAREAGLRAHDSHPGILELRDALIGVVRKVGEPAFARAGLDAALREELFTAFGSFMWYLAAAGGIDPRERWQLAQAFSSATPMSGLNAMRASGIGPDQVSVGREIAVDVEHGSMLADKQIAKTVSQLLEQSSF